MTGAGILAILSDPVWGPLIGAVAGIIFHRYAPILDPILAKLPGAPQPATPAAPAQPGVSDFEARIIAVERAIVQLVSPTQPAQQPVASAAPAQPVQAVVAAATRLPTQ